MIAEDRSIPVNWLPNVPLSVVEAISGPDAKPCILVGDFLTVIVTEEEPVVCDMVAAGKVDGVARRWLTVPLPPTLP